MDEIEQYQQEIQGLSIELAQLNAQLGDPALDQNSSLATQLRRRRAQKARAKSIANQNLDRAQRSVASIEYQSEVMQQGVDINSPLNLSGQRFKQGGTLLEPDNSAIAHWIERMLIDGLSEDEVDPWLWKAWEDAVGDVYTAFPKWADDLLFGAADGDHMANVRRLSINLSNDHTIGSTTPLTDGDELIPNGKSIVDQSIRTGTGDEKPPNQGGLGHRRQLTPIQQEDVLTADRTTSSGDELTEVEARLFVRKRAFSTMAHEFAHALDIAINKYRTSLRWGEMSNPPSHVDQPRVQIPFDVAEQADKARREYIDRATKYPVGHPQQGEMKVTWTNMNWRSHEDDFFETYQARLYSSAYAGEISPEYITVNVQKYLMTKYRMYDDRVRPHDVNLSNAARHSNTPYGVYREHLKGKAPELLKLLDLLFEDSSDRMAKRLGRSPSTEDSMTVVDDDLLDELGKGLFEPQDFNPTS